MAERIQCEFQLIRYVPDPVRNEFVNIGVLLRDADGGRRQLRFTRDWGRVRCLDPDADIEMLEGLEIAISQRIETQAADHPKPIMPLLESSLSNGVQLTEAKAYLPETFLTGLEDLMRLYIEPPRRERKKRVGGRAAVLATMRSRFEEAGVWNFMLKHIAVSDYALEGDPLRIDCGYGNGKVKMFQAVSLEANAHDAMTLSAASLLLHEGVKKKENVDLLLTAIIEPIVWPTGDGEPEEERKLLYHYAGATMTAHGIRVMTTSDLPLLAQTAREEMRL